MKLKTSACAVGLALLFAGPAWPQVPQAASSASEAGNTEHTGRDDKLKTQYDEKALARVKELLKSFSAKAGRLKDAEDKIQAAEEVISKAIVDWDALQKKVETETKEVSKRLAAPSSQPANGTPCSSQRDELVDDLRKAIQQLKDETKPYLSNDELRNLEQPNQSLPVSTGKDKMPGEKEDVVRLRLLHQRLALAKIVARHSTPEKTKWSRDELLEFIRGWLRKDITGNDLPDDQWKPIENAIETLKPKESE